MHPVPDSLPSVQDRRRRCLLRHDAMLLRLPSYPSGSRRGGCGEGEVSGDVRVSADWYIELMDARDEAARMREFMRSLVNELHIIACDAPNHPRPLRRTLNRLAIRVGEAIEVKP